ncbi:MAG: CHRD domain-containing protein [Chloroflexi bacterium]|nr:CHRD domain-containing protein [Chloroflexota bacterium]
MHGIRREVREEERIRARPRGGAGRHRRGHRHRAAAGARDGASGAVSRDAHRSERSAAGDDERHGLVHSDTERRRAKSGLVVLDQQHRRRYGSTHPDWRRGCQRRDRLEPRESHHPCVEPELIGTGLASELVGPLAGNWDGFVSALRAGTLYVNVHTSLNPGGAIRGQVTSGTTQPASQATAMPTAAATATPTATVRPTTATLVATSAPAATAVATAAPAAPRTGNAGLASEEVGGALLALLAIAAVAGGRLLTARRRD